jgi:hypothetical protein
MAHFTQLGLSESPDKKPETKPHGKTLPKVSPGGQRSDATKLTGKRKTAALVGSLAATALLGVFVLESGCSKESGKTATIAMPNQSVASQPSAPISAAPPTATPVASQPPAKKRARQRKLSASTYTNPAFGVSFRYPKYGNLKEGDDANLELDGLGTVEMNFVQPGGTTISAVELPRKLYTGTDFNAAFFNVSVNPELTAAGCEQFAFPEKSEAEADSVLTSKTKVGRTEFRAVEGFAEAENNQADVKYYHVFENGSCYEFALGLETAEALSEENNPAVKAAVKPLDRNEVFRQLNWMLSTVKIKPLAAPQKTAAEVATETTTAPTNQVTTEAH